ncbi:hypothetical protein Tco_1211831 [Tanacetum coccineum]
MALSRRSGNNDNNNNENPDIAAIIAHQLQTILPQFSLMYLPDWILNKRNASSNPTNYYSNAILRAGILTNEAVNCGTLTKGNDKRKVVEESGKLGGSWKDNKKEKVGTGFVATAPPRNEIHKLKS